MASRDAIRDNIFDSDVLTVTFNVYLTTVRDCRWRIRAQMKDRLVIIIKMYVGDCYRRFPRIFLIEKLKLSWRVLFNMAPRDTIRDNIFDSDVSTVTFNVHLTTVRNCRWRVRGEMKDRLVIIKIHMGDCFRRFPGIFLIEELKLSWRLFNMASRGSGKRSVIT